MFSLFFPLSPFIVQLRKSRCAPRGMSRSKNSIGKEEPFWALPGNCIVVIEGCASLCALPVSLNGANRHARGAPLIRIALISKNDGSKDAALPPSCGKSYRHAAFLEVA